jgi:hypothetical protein
MIEGTLPSQTRLGKATIKTRNDRAPISTGRLTVRKTQTETAAMKPATPSALRPAKTTGVTILLPVLLLLTLPAVVQALFQRSAVDESSRPFLPPPLALK